MVYTVFQKMRNEAAEDVMLEELPKVVEPIE
jgi:hypothetical protein